MPTAPAPALAPRDWPLCWFARLEESLRAGDFDRAADAARHLRRLGFVVSCTRPATDPVAAPQTVTRPAAAGKAVVHA